MTTAVKQLNQHSESPSYGQAEADVKRLGPPKDPNGGKIVFKLPQPRPSAVKVG